MLYDFNGKILVNPEIQVESKKNNPNIVEQFLNVARSYLGQTDIEYKDGDTIIWTNNATNGIDCSTFVSLVLMGWNYEQTPYYTHRYINRDSWQNNSDYNWSSATIQYKLSRFIDGHDNSERMRLACQLGAWMEQKGTKVSLDNGFRDVQPGDIVFWAYKSRSTGTWTRPTWYRHITHVGIVLSKEAAPDTYEYTYNGVVHSGAWDKEKYPFKHTIIEATTTTPPVTIHRYLEFKQDDATAIYDANVNTISMVCRYDLGSLPLVNI